MFESMKNAAKLAGMVKDLPRIRAKLESVKAELATRTVTASAGGGAVTAVASGKLRLVDVQIGPALLAGLAGGRREDHEQASQLVAEAVNEALDMAQRMVTMELTAAARELDIELPQSLLDEILR